MSKHLYEEIDDLHRVIERLNASRESLEAQFDQMVMECFEVVSTTDVDQNGNHIERSVPKHHLLAADVARLEEENTRLRKALRPFAEAANHYSNGKHRPPEPDDFPCQGHLQVKHLRAAKSALEAKPCPPTNTSSTSVTPYSSQWQVSERSSSAS